MKTTYSEAVQKQADDFCLIQQATEQLEEILKDAAESSSVDWALEKDDQGRPVYVLTLEDPTGAMSRRIYPDELQSPHLRRIHTYRIWGDLLHAEDQRRIDRMAHAVHMED